MTKLSTPMLQHRCLLPLLVNDDCFVSQELLCHECMTLHDCPLFYLPTNFNADIASSWGLLIFWQKDNRYTTPLNKTWDGMLFLCFYWARHLGWAVFLHEYMKAIQQEERLTEGLWRATMLCFNTFQTTKSCRRLCDRSKETVCWPILGGWWVWPMADLQHRFVMVLVVSVMKMLQEMVMVAADVVSTGSDNAFSP